MDLLLIFLKYTKKRKDTSMNILPNDPVLLLSVVNTKLRDFYKDLDDLCEDMSVSKGELIEKMRGIDYEYDEDSHQFV